MNVISSADCCFHIPNAEEKKIEAALKQLKEYDTPLCNSSMTLSIFWWSTKVVILQFC